jgi:uncharacterized SAM-binding protein YcdF (DUF218 family)
MSRVSRALIVTAGSLFVLLAAGFIVFANVAMQAHPEPMAPADGIVVLTGRDDRIREGLRLLHEKRAPRLLISGVNRLTRPDEIRRIAPGNDALFECCVYFGYVALDTSGNADEARVWALDWHIKKLIVVTSAYHMPRSLAELGRALPSTELVPYPVMSRRNHSRPWWLRPGAMRTLVSEYFKFLPAAARYAGARIIRPLEVHSAAAGTEPKGGL